MALLMQEIRHTIKTMACMPMELENTAFSEPWGAVQMF